MRLLTLYLPAVAFLITMVAITLWPTPLERATTYVSAMGPFSHVVFIWLLASGVVFAPLVVMPLIPIGTALFGPFLTGVLSVTGWTIGACIAFWISRYLGRPIVERWIDLSRLDALVARFPHQTHFWLIVILRHTLPVDMLS